MSGPGGLRIYCNTSHPVCSDCIYWSMDTFQVCDFLIISSERIMIYTVLFRLVVIVHPATFDFELDQSKPCMWARALNVNHVICNSRNPKWTTNAI